jgi:hypothetical protein
VATVRLFLPTTLKATSVAEGLSLPTSFKATFVAEGNVGESQPDDVDKNDIADNDNDNETNKETNDNDKDDDDASDSNASPILFQPRPDRALVSKLRVPLFASAVLTSASQGKATAEAAAAAATAATPSTDVVNPTEQDSIPIFDAIDKRRRIASGELSLPTPEFEVGESVEVR